MQQQVSALRQDADLLILLSRLGLQADVRLAQQVKGIDLIISTNGEGEPPPLKRVGRTWIACTGTRGEYVGEITFRLPAGSGFSVLGSGDQTPKPKPQNPKPSSPQVTDFRLHPVELSLPEDPTIKALIEDYYTQVSTQFLTSGQYRLTELNYATADACAVCHRSQYESWLKTQHAHAYETLVAKNRHHVPECLTCHSEQFRRTQPPPTPQAVEEVRSFHPAKQTTGQQTTGQQTRGQWSVVREWSAAPVTGTDCCTACAPAKAPSSERRKSRCAAPVIQR